MLEMNDSYTGMATQKFKTKQAEWTKLNTAYTADAIVSAPHNFIIFRDHIKEANEAILSAGIDGIEPITLGPSEVDAISMKVKNSRLGFFTEKIHGEAETYVDDPFVENMNKLFGRLSDTNRITIVYNNITTELDYKNSPTEQIREFFEGILGGYDEDSNEFTNNKTVNNYIREFDKFDTGTHQYVYENMLDHWDSLNADQKEALRHMYEYSFRQMEKYIDSNSAEAQVARAKLNRMQKHFSYIDVTYNRYRPSSCAVGLYGMMNKDSAHSYEFLEDINVFDCVSELKDENGQIINGIPTRYNIVIGYDKAGITLDFIYDCKELSSAETRVNMGYYTSQSRCLAYVYDQEHSNPSCYSHQKELGFTTKFLADLLLTAESTKDMEILDNLTKGHGQSYDQILVGNPEELTLSAAGSLVFYNRCLSIMYYKHGDEKCRQEAARMNDFLMRGEAPYSIDYSNKYNYAAIMMDTDEGVPKDIPLTQAIKEFITGSLGAFGRGVESEFIIWPVAINDLLYSINKDNVTPLSTEELKSIGPIRDTLSEAALSRMDQGHLMEYTLNQRLEYYMTVMNSKFAVDKAACAKDLRNIYYSYAEYVLDQTINLRVTDEENKMLGVLTELIKYYDSNFEIKCSLDEQNKKIQEAAQDYPVSFTVGKLGADMAIYAMFNFAAGAACAGGYEALGAGGRILAGTAADVLIKDLPRAIDTYAITGNMGYASTEFTKELVLDIGANAIGEVLPTLFKAGSTSKVVDEFNNVADKEGFLKNLSGNELEALFKEVPPENLAEFIKRYPVSSTTGILQKLDAKTAAGIMDTISSDEATALLSKMDGIKVAGIINEMDLTGVTKIVSNLEADKTIKDEMEDIYYVAKGRVWEGYLGKTYGSDVVEHVSGKELYGTQYNNSQIFSAYLDVSYPNVIAKGGSYERLDSILKKYGISEVEYLNITRTPQHLLPEAERELAYKIRMELTADVTDSTGVLLPGTRICKAITSDVYNMHWKDGDDAVIGNCIALERDMKVLADATEIVDSTGLRYDGSKFVDGDKTNVFYLVEGNLMDDQPDVVIRVSATTNAVELNDNVLNKYYSIYPGKTYKVYDEDGIKYKEYAIDDISSSNDTYLNAIWTKQSRGQADYLSDISGVSRDNIVLEEAMSYNRANNPDMGIAITLHQGKSNEFGRPEFFAGNGLVNICDGKVYRIDGKYKIVVGVIDHKGRYHFCK